MSAQVDEYFIVEMKHLAFIVKELKVSTNTRLLQTGNISRDLFPISPVINF